MDPLKAAAATAVCLVLFWLAFRLTRHLVDLAIAGGYAEERRRLAEEEAQAASDAGLPASDICTTAANSGSSSVPAIDGHGASIGLVSGAPAKSAAATGS